MKPEGIFIIMPTPLTESGAVDEKGLRHLVDYCCEQEFQGIVVLGSNGEFPFLSAEEKKQVIRVAADQAKERLTVVAGVSAFGTDEACELAKAAAEAGCDAVISAMPLYFKIEFEQVVDHLERIHEKGGLPIFFYYYPDTTRLLLTPEQIGQIADLEGVIGAKLTAMSVPFLKSVVELTKDKDFAAFTGMTVLMQDCLEAGGAGVFCPHPLLGPADAKSIWQGFKEGDRERMEKAQEKFFQTLSLFSGVSYALEDSAKI
ncbi:MAG: dihydrodipicolinate synthase family protein, partial [Proteobacteria bacterium]|nr:dihydrodipicolinate synthase family protein [Pseudomonadota bacterium]